MKRMIRNKLNTRQDAIKFLSAYDDDVIEYIRDYIYELDNLDVVEFRNDEFVPSDASREQRSLRREYLLGGLVDYDFFSSESEFDKLVAAVRLADGG